MNKVNQLKQKANHYLPCFINECKRHDSCLHWLINPYVSGDTLNVMSVNPRNPEVNSNHCPFYRENKIVKNAKGMNHLLDEIPYNDAKAIKRELIRVFSRKRFYEYRNGTRLISPEQQAIIAQICKAHGWNKKVTYDGWEEDFMW